MTESVEAEWGALLFPASWREAVCAALERLPQFCHPSSGNISWKKVRAATGASAKLSAFLAPDDDGVYTVKILPPTHVLRLVEITGVPIPRLACDDRDQAGLLLARTPPRVSYPSDSE